MTAVQVLIPLAIHLNSDNNSSRMFSLFPKALLGPLLNSNVESSPLKKGYVMPL
jgi:hypothetical protein